MSVTMNAGRSGTKKSVLVAYRRPALGPGGVNNLKIPPRSKFGLRLLNIQSGRVSIPLLPFFPPHNRDGDIIPVNPRIRSGNAQHSPQLVIVRPTQRVPDQVSAGIIVNESPSAFCEFSSVGLAFYRHGTRGRRNELGELGFRYRALEAREVASDQGDHVLGGELVPETYSSNESVKRSVWWKVETVMKSTNRQ